MATVVVEEFNTSVQVEPTRSQVVELGIQGIQGVQGPVGPIGPQGNVGAQGPQGAQGVQGNQGPAGQSFVWRGTWVVGTTYALDDVVQASDGSTYISKVGGNTGHDPVSSPAQWDTMSIHGAQGVQGPQGAQGIQGPQGVQGIQGVQGLQGVAVLTWSGTDYIPTGSKASAIAKEFRGPTDPSGVAGVVLNDYDTWVPTT